MAKHEGVKTVVLNGKKGTPQQYCKDSAFSRLICLFISLRIGGIVGGQSTDFSTIDTEVKTTHLKDHELAPPDM